MKQMSVLKRRSNFCSYLLISLLFVCLTATGAYAGSGSSVPNTFSSGSTAVSSEVNANFSYFLNRCWDLSGSDLYYSDGNVGIGTTSPSEKFEVSGNILASGSAAIGTTTLDSYYKLYLTSSGTTRSYIGGTHGELWVDRSSSSNNSYVIFRTGSNEDNGSWAMGMSGDSKFLIEDRIGTDNVRFLIDNSGNVGIGTTSPSVVGRGLEITGQSNVASSIRLSRPSYHWDIVMGSLGQMTMQSNATADAIVFTNDGNVGIGTTSPQGKLDVNGTIYQRGSSLHADYVFEDNYQLESIDEHTEFMWNNKHLKAVPKAKKDENGLEIVEVGSHQKGIVEELEKAHIYISQLNESIKKQQDIINMQQDTIKTIETMQQGYQKTISDLSEAVDVLKAKINQ